VSQPATEVGLAMGSFGTHPAVRLAAIRKSCGHVMAVEGVVPRIETAVQQVWPFPERAGVRGHILLCRCLITVCRRRSWEWRSLARSRDLFARGAGHGKATHSDREMQRCAGARQPLILTAKRGKLGNASECDQTVDPVRARPRRTPAAQRPRPPARRALRVRSASRYLPRGGCPLKTGE
jgi:hypothetical protein